MALRSVKLGCLHIPVISSDLGHGLLGEYSGAPSQVIKVHSGLAEPQLTMTVWHELIHAISDTMDLGLPEAVVRALEHGLCSLVHDNPEMALRSWVSLVGERQAAKVIQRLGLV
jgi:hypothetical protein